MNVTNSDSVRFVESVDLWALLRAEGFVRLYIALKIAGIVAFGWDPLRLWNRLSTDAAWEPRSFLTAATQISMSVSTLSSASACNKFSNMRRLRFRNLEEAC